MIISEKLEDKLNVKLCFNKYGVFSLFCSCGGVEIYNDNGKIKVSNTLESRMELIAQQVE